MKFKNYLFDLYPEYPIGFNLEIRKDPEQYSKQLYDDIEKIFFSKEKLESLKFNSIKNKCQNFGHGDFYTLFIDDGKYRLSSDYIGASVYWAKQAGLSDEDIVEYLMISRTIGGHIVFPRGQGTTVNKARGGDKAYYDRFDLTLLAIKKWYLNDDSKINYAIENYRDWFALFESFDKFVSFFGLEGFIYDESIIDLVSSDLEKGLIIPLKREDIYIPSQKEEYRRYFNNSNKIIKDRTEKLDLI
ncbi:DUF6994 family protein [Stomatobaculum longum]|uniref:DUF6994 family protein n=1 Tax=Stomatobaculum longum TaxID=796942 RepID=UPI002805D11B|nr:hypothetical protein [Stomatobaculum longum]